MWIRLPNGRNELVVNEDHIKRLLAEGGVEISDPRISVEQVTVTEPVVVEEKQVEALEPASIATDKEISEEQPEHKQRKRKGAS